MLQVELKNNLNRVFYLFYNKTYNYLNIISSCVPLNPPLWWKGTCLYTQKSTLPTVVSCADNDGGDGVSSLALDPFLSLQSQWQSVLFLPVPVQNQSSVMD